MMKNTPFELIGRQLDVDFERDTLPVMLDKLVASGMTTFRINWRPDVVLCMAFEAEGCKMLNETLDIYLETLGQTR